MNRWKILCLLSLSGFCAVAQASAQPLPPAEILDQPVQDAPSPAGLAGSCVSYLSERSRLQYLRSSALDPLLARNSMLDSALAVLSLPAARPSQAREILEQVRDLNKQILGLQRVLQGHPAEPWFGQPRALVQERIDELQTLRSRKAMLAQAYGAGGRDRLAMLDARRAEKQTLSERIDAIARPFEQRLQWLYQGAQKQSDLFKQAMQGFAQLADLDGVKVQAVRVHAVFTEGRLTYSWTDGRGSVVASAHLWLRVRPDHDMQPPLVLDRYPVLLQNQQEAQISAGHFLIDFRVSVDELSGEQRVLDTATKLLDIDRLGRLIPRLGTHGLD